MKKKKLLKEIANLRAQIKPTAAKKGVQRLFSFPSLTPSTLNAREYFELQINTNPDNDNTALRHQARSLVAGVPLISGFLDNICSELLGDYGIQLNIASGDKNLNSKIEKAWQEWCDQCDIFGVYDFYDFENLLLRAYYTDGEAFFRLYRGEDNLKLEYIDAEKIAGDYSDENSNTHNGIQRKKNSYTPEFYFVREIDDRVVYGDTKVMQIPASQIIHVANFLTPLQFRGTSKFASVVGYAHAKYALLQDNANRSRLGSNLTGWYINKNANGVDFDGGEVDNYDFEKREGETDDKEFAPPPPPPPAPQETELPIRAEVGTMKYLDADVDVKLVDQYDSGNLEYILKSLDRETARALNISYATLTGDLREVNYSSIRHGATSERRGFRRLQWFFIRKFHYVIFKEWLKIEALRLRLSDEEYKTILAAFEFKPQGWDYVDPAKEASAAKTSIEAGFGTITQNLLKNGITHDEFLEYLEQDREIREKIAQMGLNQNNNNTKENEDNDDDE